MNRLVLRSASPFCPFCARPWAEHQATRTEFVNLVICANAPHDIAVMLPAALPPAPRRTMAIHPADRRLGATEGV